jgi:retinol dehydrogenase 12
MTGKVCVVTGATSGIGFVTARELARQGATVLAGARDPTKGRAVIDRIKAETGSSEVSPIVGDLSLLEEVRSFARQIREHTPRVDVLVNNAGAIFARRELTREGHERTWALNVLAPFLLSSLLLDRLAAGAPARIVNVSSAAHHSGRLDLEDPEGARSYSGWRAYATSKLALILITHEFARRLQGQNVTANSLHPGFVATRFGHSNPGALGLTLRILEFVFGIRPPRGARTTLYLSTSPDVTNLTGRYFDRSREALSASESYDPVGARRLWELCCTQTGIRPESLMDPASEPKAGVAGYAPS